MSEVLLITNDDGYTEVYNVKAFWRLGPHKYSERFLLTVNRKHIQGYVLSSNSVLIHDVYFQFPY